jgi:metallo-beta-lactamase family protein
MSAHGDYEDLCQYLSCQNPDLVSQLFIVHGDYEVQQDFAKRLERKGFGEVIIPEMHQTVQLSNT